MRRCAVDSLFLKVNPFPREREPPGEAVGVFITMMPKQAVGIGWCICKRNQGLRYVVACYCYGRGVTDDPSISQQYHRSSLLDLLNGENSLIMGNVH